MLASLVEFITLISSGCLNETDIARIADEAAQAYADEPAFLATNPDINYDESFPIPLGEWVVIGSLPDTVLFQGDTAQEVFAAIRASFTEQVSFVLKPKDLHKADMLTALKRIQTQLSALYKEKGGYVLVDLSEQLDDALQMVLVYQCDLSRVLELALELGIYAAPAYESRLKQPA